MMVATMVLAEPAMAQELSSSGVMNDVLKRFHDAASQLQCRRGCGAAAEGV